MFGHTLLKINSKQKTKHHSDLLDWGISFAAKASPDENMFAFVFLGLSGGYIGQFSLEPYYVKVNQYSNAESRDIWEYTLNLSEEEVLRLVYHVWEIETNSYFDYFFVDENCSYQILTILEVAKPSWNLADKNTITIPSETVKQIWEIPGAVRDVKFRPSLRKRLFRRYKLLNDTQKENFHRLIDKEAVIESVSDPLILDTISYYLNYLKQKNEGTLEKAEKQLLRQTLLKRSRLSVHKKDLNSLSDVDPAHWTDSRPELGHYPARIGLTSGIADSISSNDRINFFQEIEYKFAYHDLLNKDIGYVRNSHIDFPWIRLRYYPHNHQVDFDPLYFLGITSLYPLNALDKKLSYGFELYYYSPKDLTRSHEQVFHFDGGAGLTFNLGDDRNIFYLMAMGYIEVGNTLRKGYRWGPKIRASFLLNPFENFKLQILADLVVDLDQSDRAAASFRPEINQSLSLNQSWELRSSVKYIGFLVAQAPNYSELRLSLNYYY